MELIQVFWSKQGVGPCYVAARVKTNAWWELKLTLADFIRILEINLHVLKVAATWKFTISVDLFDDVFCI